MSRRAKFAAGTSKLKAYNRLVTVGNRQRLVQNGLLASALVWTEGMATWAEAASVLGELDLEVRSIKYALLL